MILVEHRAKKLNYGTWHVRANRWSRCQRQSWRRACTSWQCVGWGPTCPSWWSLRRNTRFSRTRCLWPWEVPETNIILPNIHRRVFLMKLCNVEIVLQVATDTHAPVTHLKGPVTSSVSRVFELLFKGGVVCCFDCLWLSLLYAAIGPQQVRLHVGIYTGNNDYIIIGICTGDNR